LYGVLINEISAAYPIDLIYGLQSWAEAKASQLVIGVTDGRADYEAAVLENFRRLNVEGVVYSSTFTAIAAPHPSLESFHHVLLNCRRGNRRGFAVLPAERHGGALATEHLLSVGRRRIATITGDPWQMAAVERLAGYHRALNKAGRNCGSPYEKSTDWGHEQGYAATLELLALAEPPDAIFCQNDLIARGAMAAALQQGLSIPDDLAIVGYDEREFAKDFGISSVTLPFVEMAEKAMEELERSSNAQDKTITVSGHLVQRASSVGGALPSHQLRLRSAQEGFRHT
jgi:LacI family transcriptional regulator